MVSKNNWREEFRIASSLGYDYIELIAEVQHNVENPIWTNNGIAEIKKLTNDNKLSLHALCNDYVVEHFFFQMRCFNKI